MMLLGLVPLGTLVLGALGSALGLPLAFGLGGAVALMCGLWIWIRHPALREA